MRASMKFIAETFHTTIPLRAPRPVLSHPWPYSSANIIGYTRQNLVGAQQELGDHSNPGKEK